MIFPRTDPLRPGASAGLHSAGRGLLALVFLVAAAVPLSGGQLVNLSARAVARSGSDALFAGFVVQGPAAKRVLVRAAGPALASFGVTAPLTEPALEVFRGRDVLASNRGWDAAGADRVAVAAAAASVGAFAFAAGSADAALVLQLEPGAYTAVVSPARPGVATGIALVEIYDLDPDADARLVNLSARAVAGAGDAALVLGAAMRGDGNRLLVRGVGPSLAAFGVPGALARPELTVFRNATRVAFNDDWAMSADRFELVERGRIAGAFELSPAIRDAALLVRAEAGPFTAHVDAGEGNAGVALAEIYDTTSATELPPVQAFDLVGFAGVTAFGESGVTGGGEPVADYDPVARSGNYWRIDAATTATPNFSRLFRDALASDVPLVVELNTMIDLTVHGTLDTNAGHTALAHPDLFSPGRTTGFVGGISLGSNKTIYSATGTGGFRRGKVAIQGRSNIMLRNLTFRELWEWDDATQGAYDRNDWDLLNISSNSASSGAITARAQHIWIDHCEFEQAYDGQLDVIRGSDLVTVSWCRFSGDYSTGATSWIERQMSYLEANQGRFPYYASLRQTRSAASILASARAQKKSSLVGNSADAATRAQDLGYLNVTYHHNWYHGVDQRMPRLRFGNAHVFSLFVDSTPIRLATGSVGGSGVAATSGAAVLVENSLFVDVRTPLTRSAGSEPDGSIAIAGSDSVDAVTGESVGFNPALVTPLAGFRWNVPASNVFAGWPGADVFAMPAGYFPGGDRNNYVQPREFLREHLHYAGVIVPRDADVPRLRRWLQSPTPSRAP